ncbi:MULTISPECIES: DUF6978 family protein [Staphylococcus]|nr:MULTISPECIES: hypothetical protein [Staphylococcus]VEG63208.1 Uncharacterised protein [Staphylococcus condimenti]
MEDELYQSLLNKVKVFEKKVLQLPMVGQQTKYGLIHLIDENEKFILIINKKGHRNKDNLTIILNSKSVHATMVRFDVNGSDHINPPNKERIPTPHLHIFTEKYKNGGIAIPLSELVDTQIIKDISEALEFFVGFSNINMDDVIIEPNLFS